MKGQMLKTDGSEVADVQKSAGVAEKAFKECAR
jgi:hypothetical protein